MKLHHKIFGIGLVTAVIVPHLSENSYRSSTTYEEKLNNLSMGLVVSRMSPIAGLKPALHLLNLPSSFFPLPSSFNYQGLPIKVNAAQK